MTYDPQKPAWDTREPGKHPALQFPRATPKEIRAARAFREEALSLTASHGRTQAGEKQKFLADNIDAEHHHRVNLECAVEHNLPKKVQITHRRALAFALIHQGKFDEARDVIHVKGKLRPGFGRIFKQANDWEAAVARDDNDECNCKRKTATVAGLNINGAEVELELKRRNMVGWVFSPRHGKVVELWECRYCHFINAHDLGPPENQAHIHHARTEAANLPLRQILEHGIPAEFSDLTLFKKAS